MWKYDVEDLKKDIDGGTMINKSGCYVAKIKRAYFYKSDKDNSEGLRLEFITDENDKINFYLFYKDKTGQEMEFNVKHLNHLVFLLKLDMGQLKNSIVWELVYKVQREVVKVLENKEIGVVIEVKEGDKGLVHNLKAFYEPNREITAYEITTGQEPSKIKSFKKKYENAKEIIVNINKETKNFTNDTQTDDIDRKIIDSFAKDMAEKKDDDEFPF